MSTPAPQANADYLASLGLQRAPFLDQIDDRFFYADPVLVQRLDLLHHLIQFGDMLLGVVGPSGSGKSTLLRQLLLRGGTTWRGCRLSGAQIPQPANLVAQLADCYGLDRNAAPDRLRADLARISETLRHNGQTAVVVIDDAHLLPDAALKALLEIGGTARETLKLLRIVLFSEPGLERRLTQAGWHSPVQPLLHSLDLPSLDDHQTAAYLMYRLAAAGYSGESPFSLTEIRALHKAAGGLPGRLNALANEMLMEHVKRRTARTASQAVRKLRWPILPIAAVTGLFFAGGLGWYMNQARHEDGVSTPSDDEIRIPVAEQPVEQPVEQPTDQPAEQATEQAVKQPAYTGTDVGSVAPAETAGRPASDDSRARVPSMSEQAQEHFGPEEPAPPDHGRAAGPDAVPDAIGARPADTPPDKDKADTAVATPPDRDGQQLPEAARGDTGSAASATDSRTARQATEAEGGPRGEQVPATPGAPAVPTTDVGAPPPDVPQPTAPVESAEPPSAPPADDTPPTASERTDNRPDTGAPAAAAPQPESRRPAIDLPADVFDKDWLLARPSNHFTLQLIGVRSPASLRGYLRDHAIPAPVAYFRTRLKGGDWYVLVQGDYPSMAAARAAASQLPASVRKGQPWPRSFTNIHADIRKTNP